MKFYFFSDDPLKGQEFIKAVKNLYDENFKGLNYFLVTDGGSIVHNNDNEAIKRCNMALKKYQRDQDSLWAGGRSETLLKNGPEKEISYQFSGRRR